MNSLSTIETEEIAKLAAKLVKEKLSAKDARKEEIEKLVDAKFREIEKGTMARGVPWTIEQPPEVAVDLQKRISEPAGDDELTKKLQDYNDDLYTICTILKVHPRMLRGYKEWETRWSELAKALNTATAGSGEEWIPTGYSSQLIEAVEIKAVVASKFYSFTMPTPTYVYPMLLTDGTAYKGGEATTDSPSMYRASTPGTDNLSFTAVTMVANYPVTGEMTEDSIVAVLPTLKKSIANAMAKAKDNCIINGDTTTTHFDTGSTVETYDARRCWMGLRRLCSDANATLGMKQDWTSWTTSAGLALTRAMYEDMGKYGIEPNDLMWVMNANMYNKFRSLSEVSTDDKFGSAATIHNGRLTAIDGVEIVKSQHVGESQNATGIYDASTTTLTQALLVYKPGFWQGVRREMKLEWARYPIHGMEYLVATTRCIWKPVYDSTTEAMVGWGYNVTK